MKQGGLSTRRSSAEGARDRSPRSPRQDTLKSSHYTASSWRGGSSRHQTANRHATPPAAFPQREAGSPPARPGPRPPARPPPPRLPQPAVPPPPAGRRGGHGTVPGPAPGPAPAPAPAMPTGARLCPDAPHWRPAAPRPSPAQRPGAAAEAAGRGEGRQAGTGGEEGSDLEKQLPRLRLPHPSRGGGRLNSSPRMAPGRRETRAGAFRSPAQSGPAFRRSEAPGRAGAGPGRGGRGRCPPALFLSGRKCPQALPVN